MKKGAQEGSLKFDLLNSIAENLTFGKIYPDLTYSFILMEF